VTTQYRTIWLSDIHLGTSGCQAEKLQHFIEHTQSQYLYLVGDIIDFWAMTRKLKWTTAHNTVVQKVLKRARTGTRVIYIPGNHDEPLRQYCGLTFGNVELHYRYVHETLSGHTILCEHGDEFDIITRYHRWIAVLGDIGYTSLLWASTKMNRVRSWLGMGHWSLSAYVKQRVKQAVSFISEFEHNVVAHARKQNVNGVLCGHIHHAEITAHNDITYFNTGDTVESCTALVETLDGEIQLQSFLSGEVEILQRYRFGEPNAKFNTDN